MACQSVFKIRKNGRRFRYTSVNKEIRLLLKVGVNIQSVAEKKLIACWHKRGRNAKICNEICEDSLSEPFGLSDNVKLREQGTFVNSERTGFLLVDENPVKPRLEDVVLQKRVNRRGQRCQVLIERVEFRECTWFVSHRVQLPNGPGFTCAAGAGKPLSLANSSESAWGFRLVAAQPRQVQALVGPPPLFHLQ